MFTSWDWQYLLHRLDLEAIIAKRGVTKTIWPKQRRGIVEAIKLHCPKERLLIDTNFKLARWLAVVGKHQNVSPRKNLPLAPKTIGGRTVSTLSELDAVNILADLDAENTTVNETEERLSRGIFLLYNNMTCKLSLTI